MTTHEPPGWNEQLFTSADVKRLYIAHRGRLFRWAIVGSLLAFCIFGWGAPKYRVVGSFKEALEQKKPDLGIKELLAGSVAQPQPQLAVFMRSYRVLKPLIQKTGVQIFEKQPLFAPHRWLKGYWEHLQALFGFPLANIDAFVFENVDYEGEQTAVFSLQFHDARHFTVQVGDAVREEGVLGVPFHSQNLAFTLTQTPHTVGAQAIYSFGVKSWIKSAEMLQRKLQFIIDKKSRFIHYIQFLHRDRHFAAKLVNELMAQFRVYLADEHQDLATEEIAYLEKRQGQVYARFESLLDDHAAFLSQDIHEEGFVGVDHETRSLVDSLQHLEKQLLTIDLEGAQLDQGGAFNADFALAAKLHDMNQKMHELKEMRKVLEQSVSQSTAVLAFASQHKEWSDKGANIAVQGADLSTAQSLLSQNYHQLDAAETTVQRYETLQVQLADLEFDPVLLHSVLHDALSQRLIQDASAIHMALKEEHSSKEGQRYKEQLQEMRQMLAEHLVRLVQVEQLNMASMREKVQSLQGICVERINQQLDALQKQVADHLNSSKEALLQEKRHIADKIQEMRAKAVTLPANWRLEKWFQVKLRLLSTMLDSITQAMEAKGMMHQLHHIESKPLDLAIPPLFPSHLGWHMALGALLGGVGGFCYLLARHVVRGFPLSFEMLQALQVPLAGKVSDICDGPFVKIQESADLESLRKMALGVAKAKVVALIGGQGPDYSYALAEMLGQMSCKSILLRCDFLSKYQADPSPGLIQLWKLEIQEVPIRRERGVDLIASGGFSSFGMEVVHSAPFLQLLERLKKEYAVVLMFSRAPLTAAESFAALQVSDYAIVTVQNERTEELTQFVRWGYDEGRWRVTFVVNS